MKNEEESEESDLQLSLDRLSNDTQLLFSGIKGGPKSMQPKSGHQTEGEKEKYESAVSSIKNADVVHFAGHYFPLFHFCVANFGLAFSTPAFLLSCTFFFVAFSAGRRTLTLSGSVLPDVRFSPDVPPHGHFPRMFLKAYSISPLAWNETQNIIYETDGEKSGGIAREICPGGICPNVQGEMSYTLSVHG